MHKDLFHAIADPTRREILRMIAYQPLNISSVAENFKISRTAVYKHIKILIDCGLIKTKKQGRECLCEPRLNKLQKISDWIEESVKDEIRRRKVGSRGQKSGVRNQKLKREVTGSGIVRRSEYKLEA